MSTKMDYPLAIQTLGPFRVSVHGQPVAEKGSGMSKIWNIFKYLITHRDMALPAEVICEVFWPEAPWHKARHSLYNSIYRLRHILEEHDADADLFVIRDGMYSINHNVDYWIDVDAFEEYCSKGHKLAQVDDDGAIENLENALELYHGDYLAENFYDDWVKVAQDRYRGLYKKAALAYADLLLTRQRYSQARDICEAAIAVEPLEEDLHARLIHSYIEEENPAAAKAHYQKCTTLMYQDSGVLPSKRLRSLYQRIQEQAGQVAATDLETIQELLDREEESEGAYFCGPESFQRLYQLERKRMVRSQSPAILVRIELTKLDLSAPSPAALQRSREQLHAILHKTLRRGDVVCGWSDTQYLLLLPTAATSDLPKIIARIKSQYKQTDHSEVILKFRERAIQPEDSSLPQVGESI